MTKTLSTTARLAVACATTLLTATPSAHAALTAYDLDGNFGTVEAYFDTNTNLYWTQNANINGPMTWSQATTWADNLTFSGASEAWRLPTVDTDCAQSQSSPNPGYNCGTLTGEFNVFYYTTLGGGTNGIAAQHNSSYNLFSNVQGSPYWSSQNWQATKSFPETTADHNTYFWYFGFGSGQTFGQDLGNTYSAWAVASSLPVTATAIPEPASAAMLAAGLAFLGARRRRQA